MIDHFADATDDHQFIHCDPERAASRDAVRRNHRAWLPDAVAAFGVAFETVPRIEGADIGINHGFDTVRFVAPVKTGARIRARFVLAELKVRPSGWIEIANDVTIEIEGSTEAGADGALADAGFCRAGGNAGRGIDISQVAKSAAALFQAVVSRIRGILRHRRRSFPGKALPAGPA